MSWLPQTFLELVLRFLFAALILAVTPIIVRIFNSAIGGLLRRAKPALVEEVQHFGNITIWFIMALIAFSQLGLEISAILLIVGIIGVALVIAMRGTLENILAEHFLSTHKPFEVGDWIQIDNHFGRVVGIDALSTVLISSKNEKIVIPNSTFLKKTIVNYTTEEGVKVAIPFSISKGDIDSISQLIQENMKKIRQELVKEPQIYITKIDHPNIQLELWLQILNPGKTDEVVSKANHLILKSIGKLKTSRKD